MKDTLNELVRSLPHALHTVKMVAVEMIFFAWAMTELVKFALQVIGGHHGE